MSMTRQQTIGRASALPHFDLRTKWERALADYELCRVTYDADAAFGPLAVAYRDWDDTQRILAREYGSWERAKTTPDGAVRSDRSWQKLSNAEEASTQKHLEPMWEAARVLAKTPAPDIAALKVKLGLIKSEEVWNDANLEGDCWELVQADVARLRGDA